MWTHNYIIKSLDPYKVIDILLPDNYFTFPIVEEVTLKKDCYDEQEVHYFKIKKPCLSKGTVLKVKYQFTNLEGVFFRCEHKNGTYDINRGDCDYKLTFADFIGELPEDYGKGLWSRSDWDPREHGFERFDKWATKHNIFKNVNTGEYEYREEINNN